MILRYISQKQATHLWDFQALMLVAPHPQRPPMNYGGRTLVRRRCIICWDEQALNVLVTIRTCYFILTQPLMTSGQFCLTSFTYIRWHGIQTLSKSAAGSQTDRPYGIPALIWGKVNNWTKKKKVRSHIGRESRDRTTGGSLDVYTAK